MNNFYAWEILQILSSNCMQILRTVYFSVRYHYSDASRNLTTANENTNFASFETVN